MKHSISYIQVNYADGKGKNIVILRGMKIREYQYTNERYDRMLDADVLGCFVMSFRLDRISFERVYA